MIAVPVVPLAAVPADEPVLRADPRDHVVVPQPGQAPLVLAALLALLVICGFAARQWWLPGEAPAAVPRQAPAALAPPPVAQAVPPAAVAPAPRVTAHPTRSGGVRHLAHRDRHPHVRHAAAPARPPHPAHLQAGRRNGEGRA